MLCLFRKQPTRCKLFRRICTALFAFYCQYDADCRKWREAADDVVADATANDDDNDEDDCNKDENADDCDGKRRRRQQRRGRWCALLAHGRPHFRGMLTRKGTTCKNIRIETPRRGATPCDQASDGIFDARITIYPRGSNSRTMPARKRNWIAWRWKECIDSRCCFSGGILSRLYFLRSREKEND